MLSCINKTFYESEVKIGEYYKKYEQTVNHSNK